MMSVKSKRARVEQHPGEVISPLLEVARPNETDPLRFCPCCGFPLTQEAREIEAQRLAKPVSPPRDAEPVKPKDEECFEGAETEREASESVTPIPEEIQTENPDDPTMTNDEYGDGSGIVAAPTPSEATSLPLLPQPPRTPPPDWMRQKREQGPASGSSGDPRRFPLPPPPPPPAKAGPLVGHGPKPIGWSGAWP